MLNGLLAQTVKKALVTTLALVLVITVFDLSGDYIGWETAGRSIPHALVLMFVGVFAIHSAGLLWEQDKAQRQLDREAAN